MDDEIAEIDLREPREPEEVAQPGNDVANAPAQKVTAQRGGAKRDSYFKQRDYESNP